MAKYRFQGALNAAVFPLVSSFQSRTVVQPQLDNNVKTNQAFYGTQESADYSIPQLLYCENVMPTAEGLMSVAYGNVLAALPGASDFDQVITLRDAEENNFLFSPANGKNYIYKATTGLWEATDSFDAAGAVVSRAYVNGRTFICYAGFGIFEYDSTADTFLPVTLTGIDASTIVGIGASNNYLIAAAGITVYWSSLVNPLDFAPSLTTGAGFSIPQDVKGAITVVLATAGGFIIGTANNCVFASYTQNARAPFTFREISNAGGIQTYEQATADQTTGNQYIWGTGGLQSLNGQRAKAISGEINDFLAGRVWEYWDTAAKRLVFVTDDSPEFQVKLAYIGSRYLVISYATGNSIAYNYALVFDTVLERWGKLKIDHVDCFSYPYPNAIGDLTYDDLAGTSYDALELTSYSDLATGVISYQPSKKFLAFLKSDGSVDLADFSYNKTADQKGVFIFGKFQLTRARLMSIQQLALEGIFGDAEPTVTAIASISGKPLDSAKEMMLLLSGDQIRTYARRLTGTNVSIAVEGNLALTSYLLEVTNDGDR